MLIQNQNNLKDHNNNEIERKMIKSGKDDKNGVNYNKAKAVKFDEIREERFKQTPGIDKDKFKKISRAMSHDSPLQMVHILN
jgi:hypothetical protein